MEVTTLFYGREGKTDIRENSPTHLLKIKLYTDHVFTSTENTNTGVYTHITKFDTTSKH